MLEDTVIATHPDEIISNSQREEALKLWALYYPNVAKVMESIGQRRQTWYDWYNEDHEFRRRADEIGHECLDQMEEILHTNGRTDKKAIIERFFVLKAKRSEIYGDKLDIQVTHEFSLNSASLQTLERARQLLEAKEVKALPDVKAEQTEITPVSR